MFDSPGKVLIENYQVLFIKIYKLNYSLKFHIHFIYNLLSLI